MPSESSEQHKARAAAQGPVPVAVVTVSDSRSKSDDVNGDFLREEIDAAGHQLAFYTVVRDDPEAVLAALDEGVASARVVIFNGGTGISHRDNTYDALSARLTKTLPGFGELFRMLSWDQVGSAAMLSRATAGVYAGSIVFSTPGSPAAVRLAWERLIRPELEHLAWELIR